MAQVSHLTGAVSCGQVTAALTQCVPYLTGAVKTPQAACCAGIQTVKGQLGTTADRRQACDCIKTAAAGIKNLNDQAITALPGACNSPLPFAITRNMNCQSIP
ncbi:hypothetical protein H6P81_019573 [Aristolochia fimbriata]|uniref:Non-specific lipid-transfer protein n=1 Tax=Aristolochia fimbriata TaxID=158543 RepID=A0AAV7DT20_ARIFI|nr:hypothetical protein H6P81_019573 [Aristolochia fimbriata]